MLPWALLHGRGSVSWGKHGSDLAKKNPDPLSTPSAGMAIASTRGGNEEESHGVPIMAVEKEATRLLARTDSCVPDVEGKVDNLVTAFQDLSLMINKQQRQLDSIKTSNPRAANPSQVDRDRVCSLCHMTGHG